MHARRPPRTVHALTPDRWDALTELFGPQGAHGGCWCMWWRLPPQVYRQQAGAANRAAFERCVVAGPPPGLLAYRAEQAVGWCSLAPHASLLRLPRSATWKPNDQQPGWAISCFYVAPAERGQGIASELLRAAVNYARAAGVPMLEAYPKDVGAQRAAEHTVYFGTVAMFARAGFVEVARRYPQFPIMLVRNARHRMGS